MGRFAAFLALLLAAGCAGVPPASAPSPTTFAVVPGKDGHVGKIVVYTDGGPRLIDTAYGGQRLEADGTLHEIRLTPDEVRQGFGPTLAALPPRPATFTLYFLEGRDELTVESRAELERILAELKRRPVPDIVVIGHTDTVGSMEYNDRLSRARAERARDLLATLGLRARMEIAGRGKREPLVPTDDNVPEPRNRRVEINVR
jgi:outer membrane protein OmpA-like peptidoglycan-associated protein